MCRKRSGTPSFRRNTATSAATANSRRASQREGVALGGGEVGADGEAEDWGVGEGARAAGEDGAEGEPVGNAEIFPARATNEAPSASRPRRPLSEPSKQPAKLRGT